MDFKFNEHPEIENGTESQLKKWLDKHDEQIGIKPRDLGYLKDYVTDDGLIRVTDSATGKAKVFDPTTCSITYDRGEMSINGGYVRPETLIVTDNTGTYKYENGILTGFSDPIKKWEDPDSDMVNHPNHYNSGKFEVIDIIDEFTKDFKGGMAFDMGNVIKYVLRCHKKNGVEDLKKARWYLDRTIEKWDDED